MRLFVAINLSPALRARIEAAASTLRGRCPDVRWTSTDRLHVTLRFLGEVPAGEVAGIAVALDACARRHAAFRLRLAGLGAFPQADRARVLWARVEDGGATARLAACLETAIASCDVERERRAFTPHVTIGRAKNRRGMRLPADADQGVLDAAMRVNSIELMRSHPGVTAPRYEVLHTAMLQGGTE